MIDTSNLAFPRPKDLESKLTKDFASGCSGRNGNSSHRRLPEKRLSCICGFCGKHFEQAARYYLKIGHHRLPKFCSHECMYEARKGKNSPLYRDGQYSRASDWKATAGVIRERDASQCRICKRIEKSICVDHAIPERIMRKFGMSPHQIENLFCLCRSCHGKKTHMETKLISGDLVGYLRALLQYGYPDAGIRFVAESFGVAIQR